MTYLAPSCTRCRHRHLPTLPCWAGTLPRLHLAACLQVYGDVCCHCQQPGCTSVEHVIPRSRGGNDSLANTRPAHLRCNLSRGVRPMAGWSGIEPSNSPRMTALLTTNTTSRQW